MANYAPPSNATRVSSGRMTLDAIKSSYRDAPDRIIVVGTEAIGKSTFASDAPSPIFLPAEEGLNRLHVNTFPRPETYDDVLDSIRELRTGKHAYETFVIDTLDALEPLLWRHVADVNRWSDIPSVEYGKGYAAATAEWLRLVKLLDELRTERGIRFIGIAHAAIVTFENPAGPNYARYAAKLHKGGAAMLREWCDSYLFATHEEFVAKATGERTSKARLGRRVLYTTRTAAWDAKNRYGLPDVLPLSWGEYARARVEGRPAAVVAAEIESTLGALVGTLDENDVAAVRTHVAANVGDSRELSKVLNVLRAKLPVDESSGVDAVSAS